MYGYGYRYNSGLVLGAGGGGGGFANTYSLDFDGVDDYVSAPQSFLNSASTFSMSLWAKKPTAADRLNIGDRIAVYQGMWLSWFSDSNLYFSVRGGANESISFSLPFDTDWHHFLCTFNNGVANVYVDGILKATQTFTAVVTPPTTGDNFRIGSLDASYFGKSTIDEVALWDSVVPIGDVWDGSGAATDLSLLATPPLHWYRNGDNGSYKSPQWLIPSNENFAANKVSNYSLSLDGIDDKVEIGTQSFGITAAISVSAWVNIPTTNTGGGGTNIQQIVCEDRASGTNRNWNLGWRGGGLNQINAVIFDSLGTAIVASTNAIVPNDGVWHHLMFTYAGDTSVDGLKLFIDGIQRAQATSANGGLRSTTAIVPTIGGLSQSITWMFEGNIDEVSIFNTVVDIADVWNGSGQPTTISGAIAHYKMGEEATFSGGVWTVPDSAGSNNGTSNAMTIDDRVGEAPNSTSNALSYNMDLVDRVEDTP